MKDDLFLFIEPLHMHNVQSQLVEKRLLQATKGDIW